MLYKKIIRRFGTLIIAVLLHSDYVPNASLTRLLGCDRQKGVGPFVRLKGPKGAAIVGQLGSTIHLSLFDAALPRNLPNIRHLKLC